jgi:hypothetical protein
MARNKLRSRGTRLGGCIARTDGESVWVDDAQGRNVARFVRTAWSVQHRSGGSIRVAFPLWDRWCAAVKQYWDVEIPGKMEPKWSQEQRRES